MSLATTFTTSAIRANPAWTQLLGLCPLLAVSNSVVNALGLALATSFVAVGANVSISAARHFIPHFARLPCFVLIIATFTTCAVLLMEAFAFDLYLRMALFVQIIVTNCMILGRAEAFASRKGLLETLSDALGTACGFAIVLLALGTLREFLATGGLFARMEMLFGPTASSWHWQWSDTGQGLLLAALPPGAFLIAGLLLAFGNALLRSTQRKSAQQRRKDE